MEAQDLMVVDTISLKNYANQLSAINRRISSVDKRLDSLYTKVKLGDLLQLIKADILTSYSVRLKKCCDYLNETAVEFENVESNISKAFDKYDMDYRSENWKTRFPGSFMSVIEKMMRKKRGGFPGTIISANTVTSTLASSVQNSGIVDEKNKEELAAITRAMIVAAAEICSVGKKEKVEEIEGLEEEKAVVLSGGEANSAKETEAVEETEITDPMDEAGTIQNVRGKEGHISGGCVITCITNMYRRQQAYDGNEVTVSKKDVYEANGSRASCGWDRLSSKLNSETGYSFTTRNGKLHGAEVTTATLDNLLKEHPAGVVVFSEGNGQDHAVLITSGSNGKYKVVDPIDGGQPRDWEAATSYKNGGVFEGYTIDKLLSKSWRLAYI